jgi:hypothetical protein
MVRIELPSCLHHLLRITGFTRMSKSLVHMFLVMRWVQRLFFLHLPLLSTYFSGDINAMNLYDMAYKPTLLSTYTKCRSFIQIS